MFLAREAAIWELEERQLQEKHQLAKRQLKDIFFLQRHQMLTRHEKVFLFDEKYKMQIFFLNMHFPKINFYNSDYFHTKLF